MSTRATRRHWLGRLLVVGATATVATGLAVGAAPAASAAAVTPTITRVASEAPASTPAPGSPATAETLAAPAQQVEPDTGSSLRSSWDARGRPHRMVVVRPDRVGLVTEGRLLREIPVGTGPVTIEELDRVLPARWLTISDGTAVLDAAVVLVRSSTLQVGGGSGTGAVHTLQLAGGASPADAASIHTGGGRVVLTGATVTSIDRATGQPVAATAAGRPMIVVSTRGRLESTDSRISDLGTPEATATAGSAEQNTAGRAGVTFNAGSTGSLVRTTLERNSKGVELRGSQGVRLDNVTVTGSGTDGLVLAGDRGTTMTGIRAIGNGENGVLVTGESVDRPVTGVATSGNQGYGIAVVGQTGTRVTGINTQSDQAGGLRISRSSDVVVTDFTATDQRIGVFTHVNSSGLVLDGIHTTGGSRGVVVEKSTQRLEVRNSTFDAPRVAGVAIGGQSVALDAVQVRDARTAVRVERGAHDIRMTALALERGRDGIVTAPATSGVVITDLVAEDVESDAVRTFTPNTSITGARITGGATGIDVAAAATIGDTSISGSEQGIQSRSPELVTATHLSVDAEDLGVNTAAGSPFVLVDSQVHALESVRGEVTQQGVNDLSLPPLNVLGAIGVPLILLAVILEELHSARQTRITGRRPRRTRPPMPLGTT